MTTASQAMALVGRVSGGEISSFLSGWHIVQLVVICLSLYRQRHDSYESDSGSDSSSDSDRGRRTLKSAVTTKVGQPHLLLLLMTIDQVADRYYHWFSELSFSSRISESTIGYTFAPCVGSFTSPGIDTR